MGRRKQRRKLRMQTIYNANNIFWSAVMANSLVVHIMLKEESDVSPKLQFNWSS